MRIVAPSTIRDAQDVLFLCRAFGARKTLDLDLSGVTWVSPLGVVAVLASALSARAKNAQVGVELPRERTARTYLHHIGFVAELVRQGFHPDGEPDVDDAYEVETCLPVASLATPDAVEAATRELFHELQRGHVPPGIFEKVMDLAVELTQNAREHGSACYMVVQTHTGRTSRTPGVHVAVADFGPGIQSIPILTGSWLSFQGQRL